MAVKNILIITYHFPPDSAVGAIRATKFAKYLPEFGWNPFILTVKDKYYGQLDESKLNELDNKVVVIRTNKLSNIRDSYLKLKMKLARIRKNEKDLLEDISRYRILKEEESSLRGSMSTLKKIIFSLFVWLPDDKMGWVPEAVLRGLRIIKKENINVIMTTSPPHSVHLIGLLLKQITGVKWVADFRDPWMTDFRKPQFVRTKLSDKIETYMEKKVVEKADLIISTTERLSDKFITSYPHINSNKFVTISNGFDKEDFSRLRVLKKYKKFTITYLGTIYYRRTPKPLLKAISELVVEKKIDYKNIVVQFIGDTRYADGESVERMAHDFNLSESVKIREWIPYHESLAEMVKSHVLLLLAPNQPFQIPGKVFEYIGLNSNIIAVLDDGATSDVLRNYNKAVLIKENDIDSFKKAIMHFYQNSTRTDEKAEDHSINLYERRSLTKKLVDMLNNFQVNE